MATPVSEGPLQRWWSQRQAPAGIFGTILGASVLAAADPADPLHDTGWAVVVTLVIYWLAERWSELLGSHLRGAPLTLRRVMEVFGHGWPMVQASYGPLAIMVIFWAFGASNTVAINAALGLSVATMVGLGVFAGRRAELPVTGIIASALFTGGLGVALIVLKAILH